jgi:hypothetical protein
MSGPWSLRSDHRLFAAVILICFAASACDVEDKPQRRMALLHQLRNCLDKVPAQGDEGYTSPCANMKVSILSGISRADLISGLGRPQWCIGKDQGGWPVGDDCPLEAIPVWSFYQLPRGHAGGGPELSCIPDKERRCRKVIWMMSQ